MKFIFFLLILHWQPMQNNVTPRKELFRVYSLESRSTLPIELSYIFWQVAGKWGSCLWHYSFIGLIYSKIQLSWLCKGSKATFMGNTFYPDESKRNSHTRVNFYSYCKIRGVNFAIGAGLPYKSYIYSVMAVSVTCFSFCVTLITCCCLH